MLFCSIETLLFCRSSLVVIFRLSLTGFEPMIRIAKALHLHKCLSTQIRSYQGNPKTFIRRTARMPISTNFFSMNKPNNFEVPDYRSLACYHSSTALNAKALPLDFKSQSLSTNCHKSYDDLCSKNELTDLMCSTKSSCQRKSMMKKIKKVFFFFEKKQLWTLKVFSCFSGIARR